ncbi:MAG: tRNA (cytosine(32)/uridine(32)-2'-O)-methyltransferase TrmJ [Chromatiales bacterium 21-64-14]|nr:MAG: tRNA (cytosine(32)/uridine(32)-2'-O)-methyltransferase TrmJ [Chromatiales bacterium 21-64-14]HQU15039.1 RNA methyltransferase [Gammaproteobacteria bacterium]
MLEDIHIVLVGTTHPGNIGGAARAMRNMGLSRLRLVRPQHFPSAEATARASGADAVLNTARLFDTLEAAVADCVLVLGTSARSRSLPLPTLDARTAACTAVAESARGAVAVVFGREQDGLSNQELGCCTCRVVIPTDPDYSSLNLAAAVQVLAYEVRMAARDAHAAVAPPKVESALATSRDVERLYEHLEQVLQEIGFLDPAHPRRLMQRLRRLFNRARLDENELAILRGMLSAVQERRPPS